MLSTLDISAPQSGQRPVLIAGGGVSGMQAALSLAALGIPVLLVEKNAHLGGQVMRLDKVYPTDHCAFCPAWSTAKACYDSPLIKVVLHAELTGLSTDGDQTLAEVTMCRPAIDPASCLFCGACADACPKKAILRRDPIMTWDPALLPAMRIDASLCDECGACAKACPVGAIDLKVQPVSVSVPVADVIYATGFAEPQPGEPEHAPEFGSGSHPDICTAMEFEAWHGESRGQDRLVTRSDGRPVRRVAFVQCAGARDVRHLPYCAAVCCMHAMKQARWLKRRQPDLDITLFYNDLRAPGAGQEAYVRVGEAEGIRLVRSRPGLVKDAGKRGVGIRYEDAATGSALGEVFDMVVVNGGLSQCPLPGKAPAAASAGPLAPVTLACGFCAEPVDVAGAVIQGVATAASAAIRRRSAESVGGDA